MADTRQLLDAVNEFQRVHGTKKFDDTFWHLHEALNALEQMNMSPGQLEAQKAMFNMAGQEPQKQADNAATVSSNVTQISRKVNKPRRKSAKG